MVKDDKMLCHGTVAPQPSAANDDKQAAVAVVTFINVFIYFSNLSV